MHATTDLTIGILSKWLATGYKNELKRVLGQTLENWDDAVQTMQERVEVFGLRYFGLFVLFSASIVGSIVIRWHFIANSTFSYEKPWYFYAELTYYAVVSLLVFVVLAYNAWRRARMHKEKPKENGRTSGTIKINS